MGCLNTSSLDMKPGFSPWKWLGLKRLQNTDELKNEVTNWFKKQAADFLDCEIQQLLKNYENRVEEIFNYVEKYNP